MEANDTEPENQQQLDPEQARKVFRKNFAKLADIICDYRLLIAPKLYSADLITRRSYKNATDNSHGSDQDKEIALANALESTINDQPDLLEKLVEILEDEFNAEDITKELKKGLKQN